MNDATDILEDKRRPYDENGISIGKADEDGITIKENISGNAVYIYFSEIDTIVQQMRKLKFDKNNLNSEDRVSTKKETIFCETELHEGVKNFSSLEGYYKTDEWKQKRLLRLKRDAYRCHNCGGTHGLEVHHKGYKGLNGGDDLDDLVTLCHRCHRNVTENNRRKRKGVYLG
jgi:hypothetical protein